MSSERTVAHGPKRAGVEPAAADVRPAPPTQPAAPGLGPVLPAYAVAGAMVMGKYRVDRVLGEGGMGLVVAATHTGLDQRVAIKFLHAEAAARQDIVERFSREAQAAAKVKSEHVARVYDVGTLESGAPYMVMEYLEGEDLDHVAEREKRLPVATVCGHILQACEALAEAHAAGIVHRDLKPANLFLAKGPDKRPMVKVLDFGISKLRGATNPQALTQTSSLLGTAYYMSPEQLTNAKAVDARSDIWALGVILYELVSGYRPFDGEVMPEVVAQILAATPVPLSERVPGVPPEFQEMVDKCLQRDARRRYASIVELASALVAFVPAQRTSVERITRVSETMADSAPLGTNITIPAPADPRSPAAASIAMPTRRDGAEAHIASSTYASGGVPPIPFAGGTPVGLAETALSTTSPLAQSIVQGPPPRGRWAFVAVGALLVVGAITAILVPRLMHGPVSGPTAASAPTSLATGEAPTAQTTTAPIPTTTTGASSAPSAASATPTSSTPTTPAASVTSKTGPHAPTARPSATASTAPRTTAPPSPNGNPLEMDIK